MCTLYIHTVAALFQDLLHTHLLVHIARLSRPEHFAAAASACTVRQRSPYCYLLHHPAVRV